MVKSNVSVCVAVKKAQAQIEPKTLLGDDLLINAKPISLLLTIRIVAQWSTLSDICPGLPFVVNAIDHIWPAPHLSIIDVIIGILEKYGSQYTTSTVSQVRSRKLLTRISLREQ